MTNLNKEYKDFINSIIIRKMNCNNLNEIMNNSETSLVELAYDRLNKLSEWELYLMKSHYDMFREEDLEKNTYNRVYKFVVDYCLDRKRVDNKSLVKKLEVNYFRG